MSWVASVGPSRASIFYPPFDRFPAKGMLRRGTVLLELVLEPVQSAQQVLRLPLQSHAAGHLSLLALPGGSFSLVVAQGAKLEHKTLRLAQLETGGTARLGFAWDCEAGWARFSVEKAGSRVFEVAFLPAPDPMSLVSLTVFDAMEICGFPEMSLGFLAVSNGIEPVGPLPGLGARSIIETSFGPRTLAELTCGDLVVPASGQAPEPVLHLASRTVPALGSFAPIRLRAPYFDLKRDLIVAPHQKLYVSGSAVEYTFGCEGVLVPACHLVNGISAQRETHVSLVSYAQVLLPSHAVLKANGACVESMFIGRMRREREKLAASVFGGISPALVPEQVRMPCPVLQSYEAKALAEVA